MKTFLLKSFLFCGGLVAIFALLSLYYEIRLDKKQNFFPILVSNFSNPIIQPEIVFLGDSHPATAIRRTRLDARYYNFSYPNENFRQALLKAKFALKNKPNVKCLVIPVDDHCLSSYRDDRNFTNMLYVADLKEIDEVYHCSALEKCSSLLQFYFPLFNPKCRRIFIPSVIDDVTGLVTGTDKPYELYYNEYFDLTSPDNPTYQWINLPEGDRKSEAKNRVAKQFKEGTINKVLVEALDELFALAAKHRVRIIGVRYPVSLDYQKAASHFDIDAVRRLYADRPFAALFDYQHLFDDKQEYFWDTDHIIPEGGDILTDLLKQDIEKVIHSRTPMVASGKAD